MIPRAPANNIGQGNPNPGPPPLATKPIPKNNVYEREIIISLQ